MAEENERLIGDCKERVAFDLMLKISYQELEQTKHERDKRDYWLDLYLQCAQVVVYQTRLKD